MTEEQARRQGMADAVIRIVASKRLLGPLVRSDDVCRVLGLTQADLRGALERFRAERGTGHRWEAFKRPVRRKGPRRWTDIDEQAFAAVAALESTTPSRAHAWLKEQGVEMPYASLCTSLRKQFNLGRLNNPSHGTYEVA